MLNRTRTNLLRLSIVLVVLIVYPLSFGPACWIVCQMASQGNRSGGGWLNVVYSPVGWVYNFSPQPLRRRIEDYANLRTNEFYIEFHGDALCLRLSDPFF